MRHYDNEQVVRSILLVCNQIDDPLLKSKAQNVLFAAYGKTDNFEAIMLDIQKVADVFSCEVVKKKLKELAVFKTASGIFAAALLACNERANGNEKSLEDYVNKLCGAPEEKFTGYKELTSQCLSVVIQVLEQVYVADGTENKNGTKELLYQCKIWCVILNSTPTNALNKLCQLLEKEPLCENGLKNPLLKEETEKLIAAKLKVDKRYDRILNFIKAKISDDLPKSSDMDAVESERTGTGCSIL